MGHHVASKLDNGGGGVNDVLMRRVGGTHGEFRAIACRQGDEGVVDIETGRNPNQPVSSWALPPSQMGMLVVVPVESLAAWG
jgi:hypothetical protein